MKRRQKRRRPERISFNCEIFTNGVFHEISDQGKKFAFVFVKSMQPGEKNAKKRIGETFSLPRSCQTDGPCFLPVTRPFEFPTISLLFLSSAFSRFCPAFVECNGKEQMRGKRVHSRALINFSPWFFKTCVSLLSMETSGLVRGYLRV